MHLGLALTAPDSSRPATLLRLRSVLITAPAVFVRWRSSEEQKQPETAIRRINQC